MISLEVAHYIKKQISVINFYLTRMYQEDVPVDRKQLFI